MAADYQKLTQALNYLAEQCGSGILNRMKAIKLVYLADRYHLRKFGRPLASDSYYGMKLGPVGTLAKDLVDGDNEFLEDEARSYAREFISPENEYEYKSVREVDRDAFSKSDLEALDFAIRNFGQLDQWKLADLTHVFPEWKKHEAEALKPGNRVPLSYFDFFENPDPDDPTFKQFFPMGDPFEQCGNKFAREAFEEWRNETKLLA